MNSDANEFESLLGQLSDGIIMIDETGKIDLINNSALKLLGGTRQRFENQPIYETLPLLIDNVYVEKGASPFYQVLKQGTIFKSEQGADNQYALARVDRSVMPINLAILPYTFGLIEDGITIIFHDKTSDLMVEKAKSEFVALVSHQLRTPVNIISWYIEKILDEKHGQLNEKQQEYFSEIYKSNKRLIDLIQSIVNVSRTDLNRINHKHETVDLKQIINQIVFSFQKILSDKKINLETEIPSDTMVLKDGDQELTQVSIQNILNNSVRYTPEGGKVELKVRAVKKDEVLSSDQRISAKHNGYVVSITDSGAGIPDEDKPKVFKKLFRGSNVQTLDVSGVGLGLYISNAFTQELGGYIWFDSKIKNGSSFYLYFPDGS